MKRRSKQTNQGPAIQMTLVCDKGELGESNYETCNKVKVGQLRS